MPPFGILIYINNAENVSNVKFVCSWFRELELYHVDNWSISHTASGYEMWIILLINVLLSPCSITWYVRIVFLSHFLSEGLSNAINIDRIHVLTSFLLAQFWKRVFSDRKRDNRRVLSLLIYVNLNHHFLTNMCWIVTIQSWNYCQHAVPNDLSVIPRSLQVGGQWPVILPYKVIDCINITLYNGIITR